MARANLELSFAPVAVVRSPFVEKRQAPRQGQVAKGVTGTVEFFPEYRDALDDIEGFSRLWILYVFHQAGGYRPKVLPPRSEKRRGVFATRSPHRPNPIGMTAVRLLGRRDLSLSVSDLDMLDGTPVLDVKPYISYADAFSNEADGWLTADPVSDYEVVFSEKAKEACAFVKEETGFSLEDEARSILKLGPKPHAYRRIRLTAEGGELALKEWRLDFKVEARTVVVLRVGSGYRKDGGALHQAFVARFGVR